MSPAVGLLLAGLPPAVIPVLTGPLTALMAMLPYLLLGLFGLLVSLFRPRTVKKGLRLLWRLKLPVAVTVASCVGVVWAARALWPDAPTAAVALAEQGAGWPLARGNLMRTGVAPDSPEPNRPGLNWVFRSGEAGFFSSPAVVGNRVYASSAVPALMGNGTGEIFCLDADSGAIVWRAAPAGYRATFSSPVVQGDCLVCGEGLHFVRDARVVCLDLRGGREGQLRWSFRTGSHVECTPVVDNDCVYFGAGDDGYYCLKLAGDGQGGPEVVWHAEGKDYPDAETSIIVHEGKVYAGLGLGGKAICVLEADTGKELKRIPTGLPVFGPPAVAGGKLYVGMGNGDYVHRAEEIGMEPLGEVWCLDLKTLEVDWKHRVGRTVLGAVAVEGDRIYFGSRDGCVYCLSTAGKPVAKFDARAPLIAAPAVGRQLVYAVPDSGILYCLDRQTLDPVWEFKLGSKPLFVSSPAVARGQVFVGTQFDGLLSVGQSAASRPTALWPGRVGGPGAGGCLDGSALPELGAFAWQYPEDQMGETKDALVAAPAAAMGLSILVPLAGGPQRRGLACLPVDQKTDQTPAPRWTYVTDNGVCRSPAVVDKTVLLVDGKPGDAGRQLHAVGLADGKRLWTAPVAAQASGVLLCTEKDVFVEDQPGVLARFDLAGNRRWNRQTGPLDRPPTVAEAILVVASGSESSSAETPALTALDRPTGRVLWRVKLDSRPTSSPVVRRDTIFLGTADGLDVRSLVDGRRRSDFPQHHPPAAGDLVVDRQWIAYVSPQGQLVVVSRLDPTAVRMVPGALPGVAPVAGRGELLFAAKDGLMRFVPAADDSQPQQWADTSWLGRPTSPMILAGSRVYVGLAGWGLCCFAASR